MTINFHKILRIFLVSLAITSSAFAIEDSISTEEVKLELPPIQEQIQENIELPNNKELENKLKTFGQKDVLPEYNWELVPTKEGTLASKLKKVYKLEINQTDTPVYMLEDVLTVRPQKGIIKRAQLFGAYRGDMNLNFGQHFDEHFETTAIEAGIEGEFRNGWDFKVKTRLARAPHLSFMQNLVSDLYVANSNFFHHRLLIGNSKIPIGIEGGQSSATLLLVNRSQLARTFGNSRKLGARIIGNHDLIDYDLGIYSSDTFFREFFPGVDFTGWVNFKPLGKTHGKYGRLTLGTGASVGTHNNNYAVGGAYVGYEYKNLLLNWEGAIADGYNGQIGLSNKRASGFYTTIAYKITPKIQLVGRFDTFDPDRKISHNWRQEYSAGINYYLKGQALKFMINYVFCRNASSSDSHRLFFGTQILL